jgi:hypothetical protein
MSPQNPKQRRKYCMNRLQRGRNAAVPVLDANQSWARAELEVRVNRLKEQRMLRDDGDRNPAQTANPRRDPRRNDDHVWNRHLSAGIVPRQAAHSSNTRDTIFNINAAL